MRLPSGVQRGVIAMALSWVIWTTSPKKRSPTQTSLWLPDSIRKVIFDAKKPLSPRPLVFSTAMSAARRSALRSLVPTATCEARVSEPLRMSTRTWRGAIRENLKSYL